jgi:uncharacterized protein YciI
MKKRFAYFYLMKREPEKIQQIVPLHVEYWGKYKSKNYLGGKSKNYLGGPFADRSGGLIIFDSMYIDNATDIIKNDPFNINDLLETRWLKEWMPEE